MSEENNVNDLDKETIEKIKEASLKEYNEMQGDKNNRTKLAQMGLIVGVIILLILILNTVLKTKDITVERIENNKATIITEIDENGRVISTQELR